MRKISQIALTVTTICALAPLASAQDSSQASPQTATPDESTQSAMPPSTGPMLGYGDESGATKHWAVTVGALLLQPKNDAMKKGGSQISRIDGSDTPTASFSFYFDDHWAIELWGAANKINHRLVSNHYGKVQTIRQQPYSISAQYQFGSLSTVFRPFVGIGYHQSKFTTEAITPGIPMSQGIRGQLKKVRGVVGTIGLDLDINPTWFARIDARYLQQRLRYENGNGEKFKLDPWTIGFSVGARF